MRSAKRTPNTTRTQTTRETSASARWQSTPRSSARAAVACLAYSPARTLAFAAAYSSSVSVATRVQVRERCEPRRRRPSRLLHGRRWPRRSVERCSSHQLETRAHVSARRSCLRVGELAQRLRAGELDPGRSQRDEDGDDDEPCEVVHLGGEEQDQPEDGEHDVCPDALCGAPGRASRARSVPAARAPRARRRRGRGARSRSAGGTTRA